MGKRLQQNQKEIIRNKFASEPFYQVCQTIHQVFHRQVNTIMLSAEDLFVESSRLLDFAATEPDDWESAISNLWSDTYTQYRNETPNISTEDTKIEVAMLHHALVYAMGAIPKGCYQNFRRKLQDQIYVNTSSLSYYETLNTELFHNIKKPVSKLEEWMIDYLKCEDSLTEALDEVLLPKKKDKKSDSRKKTKYPTIAYKNGRDDRVQKINKAMLFMCGWEWIEEPNPDDFQDLFSGKDIKVNIKWKKNTAILYVFLQELLKQTYVTKRTGISAMSIAKNILNGKTPSGNTSRLDESTWDNIHILLKLLTPALPLSEVSDNEDGPSIKEIVKAEIRSSDLRNTKRR